MSRITQPAGWILLFVDCRQSSNLTGLPDWPRPFSPGRRGPDCMEAVASRHQPRSGWGGGQLCCRQSSAANPRLPRTLIPTTRSWILAAFDEVSWSGAYALWFADARSGSLAVVALVQKRPASSSISISDGGPERGEVWDGGVHGGGPQPYNHQNLMATKMMLIPSNQRRIR